MKDRKMEISLDKISSAGCKWSSLNYPGTETPVSHSLLKTASMAISARAARRVNHGNFFKRLTIYVYHYSDGSREQNKPRLCRALSQSVLSGLLTQGIKNPGVKQCLGFWYS